MLLEGRNAVVYGGGGAIGGAIARAYAAQGARLFLVGRTAATLEAVARDTGASVAVLDALDEAAVDAHADAVVASAGSLDISVNVITDRDVQGTPMAEMAVADYLAPVETSVRARFVTARAAARHMSAQGSGVILFFGGEGDPGAHRHHRLGGLLTGFHAVEQMRRQLASELGPSGVRVVTLRTSGVPEAIGDGELRPRIETAIRDSTLLGRAATLADVGNVAVFAASDWARTLTGTAINMSCGAMLD